MTFSVDASEIRKWRSEGKEIIIRCCQSGTPLNIQTWPRTVEILINGRVRKTLNPKGKVEGGFAARARKRKLDVVVVAAGRERRCAFLGAQEARHSHRGETAKL